jgi:hypothetical protein
MEAVRASETSVDIPEDNSEHHIRRRENLKSHNRPVVGRSSETQFQPTHINNNNNNKLE